MTFDLFKRMQARVALMAIGRSTLRNQGAPGVVAVARRYLRDLELLEFKVPKRTQFEKVLDGHTRSLMTRFPSGANTSWGGARKALNIFLRDVLYSRFLSDHFRIGHLEPWLELPLDGDTYKGRVEDSAPKRLPDWPGVKGLDANLNLVLQTVAEGIATGLKIHRVHLDIKYWRKAAIDDL